MIVLMHMNKHKLKNKHVHLLKYKFRVKSRHDFAVWLLVGLLILTSFGMLTSTADTGYTVTSRSRAELDVGIEQIWDLEKLVFGTDHLPGQIVHLNITVKNFGVADILTPFKITLNITDDGVPQYCYKAMKDFPTCLGQPVVKAHTAYTINWNWTAPRPEQMPQGSMNDFSTHDVTFNAEVSTQLNNDINPVNDEKSIKIIVKKPSYKLNLKPGWWVLNQSTWDWTGRERYLVDIEIGKTNQFDLEFTLENLGDSTYINYQVTAPKGWIAIPPVREFWSSNTNSSVLGKYLSVTVFPSLNLDHLPFGKNLKLKLKAYCEGYQESYDILEFIIQVKFIPNPDILIPGQNNNNKSELDIKPPSGNFNITVMNKGNDIDYYEVRSHVGTVEKVSESSSSQGWSVSVIDENISGLLKPGEHQNYSIKVDVPHSVSANTHCPITIIARSLKAPMHNNAVEKKLCYIFADLYRDVRFVNKNFTVISMYPNSEITKVVKIRNTGNKLDSTINFNITCCPKDWDIILDSSDIPYNGLPRDGVGKVEVTLKTPAEVIEGRYLINLTVNSDGHPKDIYTFQIKIQRTYNLTLYNPQQRCIVDAGTTIKLNATVENRGNTDDTIQLDHHYDFEYMKTESGNWNIEIIPNIIDLDPYQRQNVSLSINIPSEALADTNFSTLRRDGYEIVLRASSLNDPLKVFEIEFEVVINPYYNFSLNKKTDTIYFIHQDKKSYIDSSVKISNLGNDIDLYNIEYQSEYNWLLIPYTQRWLLPGATIELFYNFESPWDQEPGEYRFKINCISTSQKDLVRTLELVVVIKIFDVSITELYIGDEPLPGAEIDSGETVLLRAKLENIGEINYSSDEFEDQLIIKFYEGSGYIGEANITYLPSPDNSSKYIAWVSVPWKVDKARDYYLEVELDPNANLPDSNRDNNRVNGSMKIKPEDGVMFGNGNINLIINSSIFIIIILIITCISIIWRRRISIKRKELGKYADEKIELFEDRKAERARLKTELNQELELDHEVGSGVLPKTEVEVDTLDKRRAKFLQIKLKLEFMRPIKMMRPVKKVKPVKKTKPIETDENITDDKKMDE